MPTGAGSKDKPPSYAGSQSKAFSGGAPKETIRFKMRAQEKGSSGLPVGHQEVSRGPPGLTPQPKVKSSCVFQKVPRWCALIALSANTAMIIAVDHLRAMFHTGVLNRLTGKVNWSVSPQICFLKRLAWVVRAVMFLAMVLKGVQMKSAAVGLPMWILSMLVRCPIIYTVSSPWLSVPIWSPYSA